MKRLLVLLITLGLFFPAITEARKWSDLIGLTTVATGDILAIIDVSATPDIQKQITWGELMAAPGAIGGTTPAPGAFTTLASDTVTTTPTSAPAVSFIDSDGADNDVSAKIWHNLTTETGGGEIGDIDIEVMGFQGTPGTLETAIHIDGSEQTINLYGTVVLPDGYDRHIDIIAGAATVGNVAPTPTTIEFARGLGFDADAELAFFNWEVPFCWDGVSDFNIQVIWFSTSGDAVENGETVKLDLNYYSILEGETIDNGTPVEATTTYTASGAQTDKEMFETVITIDYDHADQPLTKGDTVTMQFNRDTSTDTYTGSVIVLRWEIMYNATGIPYQ